MKNINQNLRFSIHASLLALLCFSMIPSAIASHMCQSARNNADMYCSSGTMTETSNQRAANQTSIPMRQLMVAYSTDEEVDMQAKRQEMIKDCEDNRGVDCEKKVDTELEAQQLNNNVITDDQGRLRPRPRAKSRY